MARPPLSLRAAASRRMMLPRCCDRSPDGAEVVTGSTHEGRTATSGAEYDTTGAMIRMGQTFAPDGGSCAQRTKVE